MKLITDAAEKAQKAAETIVSGNMNEAMNKYN